MNKISIYFFFVLLMIRGVFPAKAQNEINIKGSLSSCNLDSMRLFVMDGVSLYPIKTVPIQAIDNGLSFDMTIPRIATGIYFLGGGNKQNTRMLLVGNEPKVELTGQCATFAQSKIIDSPENEVYESAIKTTHANSQEFNQLINQYKRSMRTRQGLDGVVAKMKALDEKQVSLLDSLKKTHPFISKVVGLSTYLSYQNNKETFRSEAEYFAKNYFKFAYLADPAYNRMPQLHDRAQSYALTLSRLGLTTEQQQTYAEDVLYEIPEGSSAFKSALIGLTTGFQRGNEDVFAHFAQLYLQQYGKQNPQITQNLVNGLQSVQGKLIGAEAAELSLPTPEGDTLSLTDLRGKVVLVDFWASWCGPCRKENPHVKKVYEKYKDKGFEILGVSLDNNKSRWLAAIEKDGLTWKHISDLKQWRSIAAKTYGVSSIPYTVLLDAEGRILAKNLRGAQLEKKLAEVLGGDNP